MQPLIAAMIKVRQAFYAALVRSLLRTKSLLKAILNIWISPLIIKGQNVEASTNGDALMNGNGGVKGKIGVEEFLESVEREFRVKVGLKSLLALSDGLRVQFAESLLKNPQCMLPSYNHQLPTGNERGTYLALDVGGSTFRVALIELSGRTSKANESRIMTINSFKINNAIKQLKGVLFFDWMAQRIEETLSGQAEGHNMSEAPLSTGVAWSFPIECVSSNYSTPHASQLTTNRQTSLRSGLLQGMGKGFLAAHGLLGQDLGDLIQSSCSRHGLNVQLNAIVNDSSATLLSKAYLDATTRFALILGTGVNAAVHLPVHIFSPSKFGVRPAEWHDEAKHVIVNTELSMFGGGILPDTRWDRQLRATHSMPEFQPLEHFVSGGYLGEIVRLVLVEGVRAAGLFGGVLPQGLEERYSLETQTISMIEA
jgi:hexokinase